MNETMRAELMDEIVALREAAKKLTKENEWQKIRISALEECVNNLKAISHTPTEINSTSEPLYPGHHCCGNC